MTFDPPDPALLAAILANPDDGARWLALAGSYTDRGRTEEAATVRVYWPALRDGLAGGRSLDWLLEFVRLNAWRLGPQARELEGRAFDR